MKLIRRLLTRIVPRPRSSEHDPPLWRIPYRMAGEECVAYISLPQRTVVRAYVHHMTKDQLRICDVLNAQLDGEAVTPQDLIYRPFPRSVRRIPRVAASKARS